MSETSKPISYSSSTYLQPSFMSKIIQYIYKVFHGGSKYINKIIDFFTGLNEEPKKIGIKGDFYTNAKSQPPRTAKYYSNPLTITDYIPNLGSTPTNLMFEPYAGSEE